MCCKQINLVCKCVETKWKPRTIEKDKNKFCLVARWFRLVNGSLSILAIAIDLCDLVQCFGRNPLCGEMALSSVRRNCLFLLNAQPNKTSKVGKDKQISFKIWAFSEHTNHFPLTDDRNISPHTVFFPKHCIRT